MLELRIACLNILAWMCLINTLNAEHEIWLKLQELHDGTSNIREQKHCPAKQNYDSFTMNDDELVRDMYSRLNLIINELHSIGLIKLDNADIMRKIISVLPQKKYASIITILHNIEDLSNMTPGIAIGKLVAFEMSCKMGARRSFFIKQRQSSRL